MNYTDMIRNRLLIQVIIRHPRFPQNHAVMLHGPYAKITKEERAKIRKFYEMKYDNCEIWIDNITVGRPFTRDENTARIEGEWEAEK